MKANATTFSAVLPSAVVAAAATGPAPFTLLVSTQAGGQVKRDVSVLQGPQGPPGVVASAVTIRKVTAGLPTGSETNSDGTQLVVTAVAYCNSNETLLAGGCYFPPENHYDVTYTDAATYNTGGYPRPLVGMTSVPVGPGKVVADIRPKVGSVPANRVVPFDADIVADETGSAPSPAGGGWACRAGVINYDSAAGGQFVNSTMLTESWFFRVQAYATCLKTQ